MPKIPPRGARHSFASIAVREGNVRIVAVTDVLGQADEEVTRRYVDMEFDESTRRDVAQAVTTMIFDRLRLDDAPSVTSQKGLPP